MDRIEARSAIYDMLKARGRLAAETQCPPGRHLFLASLLSAIVMSQAAPVGLTFAIEGVCALAGVLMFLRERRRGVFVNGYRAGPARPLVLGLGALFVVADVAGAWLKAEAGIWWAPILAGLVLAPLAVLLSRAAGAAYRRELTQAQ